MKHVKALTKNETVYCGPALAVGKSQLRDYVFGLLPQILSSLCDKGKLGGDLCSDE